MWIKFVLQSNSVAIKKGNKLGSIVVAQRVSPSCAAIKFEEEKKSKHIAKSKNIIIKKFFLSDITKKFMIPPRKYSYFYIFKKIDFMILFLKVLDFLKYYIIL